MSPSMAWTTSQDDVIILHAVGIDTGGDDLRGSVSIGAAELTSGDEDALVHAPGHQLTQHTFCGGPMVKAMTLQPSSSFRDRAASTAFRSSGLMMVCMDARSSVLSGFTATLPEVSGTCLTVTKIFILPLPPYLQTHIGRNHDALHFTGAFIDLRNFRVTHHPLHRIIRGIAIAAEELHHLGDGFHGVLGGKQLGHGSLLGVPIARALQNGRLIGQQTACLAAQLHVRQSELRILEFADGLAELNATLGVVDSLLQSALGNAQRLGSDANAPAVQSRHGNGETLALCAQQILPGDNAVLEYDLSGGTAVEAQLLLVFAHREAGEAALHDKCGDALGATRFVSHGEHHENIRYIAVGNEDLGTVHHIMIPLQTGLRLTLGGVGTGIGLRQGESAYMMAGGQHGQIFGFLCLGAVVYNGIAAQAVVGGHDVAGGGALLAQFLDADGAGQRIGARAAILLGNTHSHDAQIKQLDQTAFQCSPGDTRRCGQSPQLWIDFFFRKLRHHLADHLMLTTEIEIHNCSPIFCDMLLQGHPASAGCGQQLAGGGVG